MTELKSISPAVSDRKTLVEEGSTFKGSLSSSCPVVIRGRFEGEIAAPSLTITASGAVHGKVKVDDVRSQGELSGEIDADTVQLSGVVKDHTVVRAKSIDVKLSPPNGKMQIVFGDCILDVGEALADVAVGKHDPIDAKIELATKGRKGKQAPLPGESEPAATHGNPPPPTDGAD